MPATANAATTPRTQAYRFVNRDHRTGYAACPASGSPMPSGGGAFYARCPVCGVTLALTARGTLPRHKAAPSR